MENPMSNTLVLTISALDLGIDNSINYMASVCKSYATAGDHTQLRVPTRSQIDSSNGNNKLGTISRGCDTLNAMIKTFPKQQKIVFGYSQGAQIASTWLRRYGKSGGPDPQYLSFLLIGNPERRYGKQPWTALTTPDDTKYKVRDVTRKGDNWADYHGTPRNRFAAMFGVIHTDYWNTDPYDPAAETIAVVGNTTYVRVP